LTCQPRLLSSPLACPQRPSFSPYLVTHTQKTKTPFSHTKEGGKGLDHVEAKPRGCAARSLLTIIRLIELCINWHAHFRCS
jgi:hypothetical protein